MTYSRSIEVLPTIKDRLGEGGERKPDEEILRRVEAQVENRKETRRSLAETSKKRPGIVKRAWRLVPGWVKVVGGALLAAWLISLLYGGAADLHKGLAQDTHAARKSLTNSLKAFAPGIGLNKAGGVMNDPGTGFVPREHLSGYERPLGQ